MIKTEIAGYFTIIHVKLNQVKSTQFVFKRPACVKAGNCSGLKFTLGKPKTLELRLEQLWNNSMGLYHVKDPQPCVAIAKTRMVHDEKLPSLYRSEKNSPKPQFCLKIGPFRHF